MGSWARNTLAASSIIALPISFLADAVGERPTVWLTGGVVCAATLTFWLLERAAGRQPAPIRVAEYGRD